MQEDQLVELLRAEFPRDRVNRIQGRSGADVEHEVFQDGQRCGVVVYESKNVQSWQAAFIPKLNNDKTTYGADYAVLVTTAFPPRQRDFCVVDGVPVIHPRLFVNLVRIIRQSLVDIKFHELSFEERGLKLEQLMIYLSGPDFKNKMQSTFKAIDKLEEMQQKERRAHEKSWKDEAFLLRSIRSSSSDIQNEVRAILTTG